MARRLQKPASVKADPYRSKKWDEVVRGRDFDRSDVPALTLLVQWYQVVDQCMEDITAGGGVQVAYSNKLDDIKPLPQIATMKQASAEIRALNKQLGIADGRDAGKAAPRAAAGGNVLRFVAAQHEKRKAAGS